ncbi:MAG: hypothetical protein NDJ92_05280 [Thermoanaerobaculia bacterium]|nr:hypothetical protein [Thermoanaerobaculia bacterium]
MKKTRTTECVSTILLLTLAILAPAAASAAEPAPIGGAELQQAMYDMILVIEKAGGLDSTASNGLYWNSPDVEQALEAIPNKKQFLEATRQIVKRSQAARIAGRTDLAETSALVAASSEVGTAAFTPNYPDTGTDLDYLVLHPLGLVSNNSSRCSGGGFAYYQAALAGANISLTAAQLACDASGCDPTGIVCISVCGATKIVQAAYLIAKVPVDACNSWDAKIAAAENEAAWKNSELALSDLSTHDDRIGAALASQSAATAQLAADLLAHDAAVKSLMAQLEAGLSRHDEDVKLLLSQLLSTMASGQTEIIKLLKTPEGRRPGWNEDGY